MQTFLKGILLLAVGMIGTTANANMEAVLTKPYEARYSVSWHGVSVGESVHRLEKVSETEYKIASETEPYLGFLPYDYYEAANFTFQDGEVHPLTYEFDAQEGLKKKKGILTFDWDNKKVHNNKNKKFWETELFDGMFDKLTQAIALRHDLMVGKSDLVYNVVEEGKYRTWRIVILGENTIETEIGEINAIKLEHRSTRRKRRTVFWVSKDHNYLLVKMEQYRKGKLVAGGEIISYESS